MMRADDAVMDAEDARGAKRGDEDDGDPLNRRITRRG